MKKCIYCGSEIADSRVMEVCDRCGRNVWGEKMFGTIVKNMDNARDNGDLCHMNNTCEFTEKTNFR
ncbi:hypothetical protein CMI44_01415 [Candidatus Pacearchaeota archaeon]|jgi:uncharacterized protein with PIN domain|nr:hypothetical protein [Candidatus Pacearchaeota archaeon]|tara:strand:+ start:412 stop:609 length:198 start_codon:yes stop_codon:yes gene_type:complete